VETIDKILGRPRPRHPQRRQREAALMGTYDKKSNDWINPPRKRRSPMDSGNNRSDKSCCFGAAAVKAARRGKYRLARRYAVRMVTTLAARVVTA
jgi:hypothetical protein